MAQTKKTTTTKRTSPKRKPAARAAVKGTKTPSQVNRIRSRANSFLARRPHRSFRRTRRRDYARSLQLPGYIAFTHQVWRTLWRHKRVFTYLIAVFTFVTVLLAGVASQETYNQLSDTLRETGKNLFAGGWGEVEKAGLLLFTGVSGSFGRQPTEAQQIYGALILLFTWLTTIWLLRVQLAGGSPRLRDSLYNAGAPVASTLLLFLLLTIQLLPMALAYIGYNAAATTGILESPPVSMLFFLLAGLLVLLSLYLIVSTFFALVVVTLPGMYPWQALRTAGDLVTGRRLRILLRLSWMALLVVIAWVIVMLPLILLTTWLQTSLPQTGWIPVVPVALTVMSTATVVFVSSYVYLLYRGIVDDGAAPA